MAKRNIFKNRGKTYIFSHRGGGGESGITVTPLTVTENGTYTSAAGQAYSPVTVRVSSGGGGGTLYAKCYKSENDIVIFSKTDGLTLLVEKIAGLLIDIPAYSYNPEDDTWIESGSTVYSRYSDGDLYVDGEGGDITVESLSVTENGTYTAPTGKAYSPVNVNVPAPTTMYCWVDNLDPHEDKAFCVIPNPKVGDKVFWTDADGVYSVTTITAVTETTLTTDRGTLTRDSSEDVVMIN